jgi:NAD(P)-dependent dehydrogenase (short-subunit alcohol dehydrogenase family)
MDLGLDEKVAMIAGGSAGIGKAVATVLASEGASVAICARSQEGLDSTRLAIRELTGVDSLTVQADFSVPSEIELSVTKVVDHFGGVDILVYCVGSSMFGKFDDVPDARWVSDINLKLFGAVRTCRAVVPHMRLRRSGRIVNIAGNSGKQPYIWHYPGGAANAALLHFSHALAQELAADNILVNAVCPGPVETRRLENQIKTFAAMWDEPLEETRGGFYANQPLRRAATPEEVAYLVAFLVSDKAAYISGTYVTIDGCITKCL